MNDFQQTNDLLKEILPVPSGKIVTSRFSKNDEEMAACSGKCASGVCKTAV